MALAVGVELGLRAEEIRCGLAACPVPPGRLVLRECCGMGLLDDTYNANADSMAAALATLSQLPCQGRRVAVLGNMAELGRHSEAIHAEIGRRAAASQIKALFAVGQWSGLMAREARAAGLDRVYEAFDAEQVILELLDYLRPGDLVLFKASRVLHLERLVDAVCRAKESCFTT